MAIEDRIVITGMGVVSPFGVGIAAFHDALSTGKSGISSLNLPWETGYQANRVGLVSEPWEAQGQGHGTTLSRAAQLAIIACKMALAEAGMASDDQPRSVGVVIGTAMGEALETEKAWESNHQPNHGNHQPHPTRPVFPSQPISGAISEACNLAGPSHVIMTACAAGNHAIAWACDLLKYGTADAMLAVGVDTISYVDILGFCRLLLQAPDVCRPFDLRRKGTILSEGAGALLLEPLRLAKRRGMEIQAEVAGWGLSCDAAGPFASKVADIQSLMTAAEKALREAQCRPEDIQYISAHGSGTRLNDRKETHFIKRLLGDYAYRVPVSSIKSMLGHAQGAAASFEAIASVLSFKHDILYPTTNYEVPDPQCDLDYVPNQARLRRVDTIMSHAFGIGGNNAIVIFKRWKGL